ncbi:hypothetical protein CsSME_00034653 [Camellia sinensis var. sinensis]
MGDILQRKNNTEDTYGDNYWCCDNQIVQAVWTLVPMCGLDDGNNFMALVSDFISRVGIGNPHSVVFHLPGDSGQTHVCRPLNPDNNTEISFRMDTGISEELLISLMRLLKKYLIDDSVKIIDMTSQTIRNREEVVQDGKRNITTAELTGMIREADKRGHLPPICSNGLKSVPICIAMKRLVSDNESS